MGKFFDIVIKTLTIIHHLIWITIGAFIIAVPVIILLIGPAKILQQIPLPTGSSSQQSTNGNNISAQNIICAIAAIGQDRALKIVSGQTQPTQQEITKLSACFPNGFPGTN